MEEVDLSSSSPSLDSGLSRKREYKRLINRAFKSFQSINNWRVVSEKDNVRTFESDNYTKGEGLLPKICQQFIPTLASDVNLQTRKQWDTSVHTLLVLESFETENGYIYYMKRQNTQGIQWSSKDKNWVIFISLSHPDYGEPILDAEFCIWVKEMEKYCFLTIIYKKRTDSIYSRIKLMENVSRDLKLCHLIYDPWLCDICVRQVPAHELECRICKKERFGRCKELSCYRVLERGEEICNCLSKK
jgi:hypothetical protein